MQHNTDKQTATACQKAPTAPTHVELTHISQELRQTQSRLRNAGQRNGELCGRIESLEGERDHYKAHADKLAEALREIRNTIAANGGRNVSLNWVESKAGDALSAYDASI